MQMKYLIDVFHFAFSGYNALMLFDADRYLSTVSVVKHTAS